MNGGERCAGTLLSRLTCSRFHKLEVPIAYFQIQFISWFRFYSFLELTDQSPITYGSAFIYSVSTHVDILDKITYGDRSYLKKWLAIALVADVLV